MYIEIIRGKRKAGVRLQPGEKKQHFRGYELGCLSGKKRRIAGGKVAPSGEAGNSKKSTEDGRKGKPSTPQAMEAS